MIGIKEFNKKIGTLKNTGKMTKTMKMVSASKFKRALKAQSSSREYADKLRALMVRLTASVDLPELPALMVPRKDVHRALVLVFSSDRGLCGGFNNTLIRKVKTWAVEFSPAYQKIDMSFCGRRGFRALNQVFQTRKFYDTAAQNADFEQSRSVALDVMNAFIDGEYDEVFLAFNQFSSAMSQTPVIEKLLPLTVENLTHGHDTVAPINYLYEPDPSALIELLTRQFVEFKIYYTLLQNAAGEHGARMTAMDKATANTKDMIDRYTLLRNRARQASITKELIEIISGSEALK